MSGSIEAPPCSLRRGGILCLSRHPVPAMGYPRPDAMVVVIIILIIIIIIIISSSSSIIIIVIYYINWPYATSITTNGEAV